MNLLPPEAMKRMRAEYRARFVLAGATVLLACALIFSLALVPVEVAVISIAPPGQSSSQQERANVTADTAALAQTRSLLSALVPFMTTSSLAAVISALSDKSAGIEFSGILYSAGQNTLSLSGHADTPEDLNAFRQALESDQEFSNVSVPVSALVGSQSGSFTVTMNTTN